MFLRCAGGGVVRDPPGFCDCPVINLSAYLRSLPLVKRVLFRVSSYRPPQLIAGGGCGVKGGVGDWGNLVAHTEVQRSPAFYARRFSRDEIRPDAPRPLAGAPRVFECSIPFL